MTTESQDNNKGAFRVAQDTPALLSADSLRDVLRLYRLKYSARMYGVTNAEERERETEICDAEFIEMFNAALQSERQRIADSLPETEDLRLPANFSPHMAYRAAIEAVRAVLTAEGSRLTSKGESET